VRARCSARAWLRGEYGDVRVCGVRGMCGMRGVRSVPRVRVVCASAARLLRVLPARAVSRVTPRLHALDAVTLLVDR
jgi:hypothetical protein